jgi:hypothetical protein
MPPLKALLTRRITPWQAILYTVLVLFVAVLIWVTWMFARAKILDARVNAAIPEVCTEVRHQRAAILNALEAYKSQFGVYPPDHLLSRNPVVVDPVTNTLLYELAGTLYRPARKTFQVAGLEPAAVDYVTNFFGCHGFKNCSEKPEGLKTFLSKQDLAWRQLHDDPDVFVLGFNMTSETIPYELIWELDIGSWQYVSSTAIHNPGKFDLWIEIAHKNRKVTVGNWKEVD